VTRSRHDIKYKKPRRKAAASRKDDIMTSEKARLEIAEHARFHHGL
jgi:hypothetical protein